MSTERDITVHYARGDLLARLNAALRADGADPARPTLEALAPYDQFHTRGQEATLEMARMMPAGPADHVLDIGCGIGGPARYFAHRFGCRVTGIDLTPAFCQLAAHLTRLLDMADKVEFQLADALAMPFADASFDGAYSMNVSMNIADKSAFYAEIRRVLKPGGWLALSEIAKGGGGALDYPTPWALDAQTSFLSTPEETRRGIERAGFDVLRLQSTREQALAFGARSRALVERGEKVPHRVTPLVHGDMAPSIMANMSRNLADGRIDPIEVLARKR